MVRKGQIVGIDWNRIAWLHNHVLAHMISLTASRCHNTALGLAFFPSLRYSLRIYLIYHVVISLLV